jgi:hypothetical protein
MNALKMNLFRPIALFIILLMTPFFGKGQEMQIYRFGDDQNSAGYQFGFISLSDGFSISGHPDSLVIADEYLGAEEIGIDTDNYHELTPVYRKRFLQRVNFNESDKVYLYSLLLDTIYTFKVRDLALVAYLNPYGPGFPIESYDYVIGFEIKNAQLNMNDLYNSYRTVMVAIGKTCPFQVGKFKPIQWSEMKTEKFPSSYQLKNLPKELLPYEIQEMYTYNQDGLDYYLMNYGNKGKYISVRYLIVVDALTEKAIYSKVFKEFDGRELIPLNISVSADNGYTYYQWTGQLLKGKPAIVFNFFDHWFDCSSLYFMDEKKTEIRISCDNRH